MKITQIAAGLAASAALAAFAPGVGAADTKALPGNVPGAEVIQVPVTTGQIDTISGIVYRQVKGLRSMRQLRMTVQVPRDTNLKPAVIYFPGGGFTSADHEKFTEMRMALARAGFVVAACEYRVVPNRFPALVEDGKAAVRYLRAHASEYGIDPARIGVLGDSAGGYLVQMLGATNGEAGWDKGDFRNESSDVQAVVTLYGISDLTSIGEGFGPEIEKVHASPAVTEALLVNGPAFALNPGASILADHKKALAASSLGHIDGTEPPFLILHGSADRLVSPAQSAKLFEAMKAKKDDVRYVIAEGAGHGDLAWYQQPVIELVTQWFKEKLGEPKPAQGKTSEGANL